MCFAKAVGKVLLVVLLHEPFVVHEEDVGGDRDGGVAIVDGGGGVEEFKAFLSFACLGWFFIEGVGEEAVEFTSGDGFLGVFSNFSEFLENKSNGLFFECRDADVGCVSEEEEFSANVLSNFF